MAQQNTENDEIKVPKPGNKMFKMKQKTAKGLGMTGMALVKKPFSLLPSSTDSFLPFDIVSIKFVV